MGKETQQLLANLVRAQRVATLGTLRGGAPEVSMVLCAAAQDCAAFFIHISTLAHHTQNILRDVRDSLMLAESDDGTPDSLADAIH